VSDPGNVGKEGALGSEGTPGTDGRLGSEGDEGAEGVVGADGRVGAEGKLGVEGRLGAVGKADGGVTHAVTPLLLDAVTDPPPAGEVRLPPPDAVTGLGIEGAAGVLTHCEPEGSACGTGSEVRLGTDVGATAVWVAPLGNVLVATAATAATPAAPAVSRMIRP
jgi:Collagen triple helix repeat (20 copies)